MALMMELTELLNQLVITNKTLSAKVGAYEKEAKTREEQNAQYQEFLEWKKAKEEHEKTLKETAERLGKNLEMESNISFVERVRELSKKEKHFKECIPYMSRRAVFILWTSSNDLDEEVGKVANKNIELGLYLIDENRHLSSLTKLIHNIEIYFKLLCDNFLYTKTFNSIADERKKMLLANQELIQRLIDYSTQNKISLLFIGNIIENLSVEQLLQCIKANVDYDYSKVKGAIHTFECAKKLHPLLDPTAQYCIFKYLQPQNEPSQNGDSFHEIMAYNVPKVCIESMDSIPLHIAYIIKRRLSQIYNRTTIEEKQNEYSIYVRKLVTKLDKHNILEFCAVFGLQPSHFIADAEIGNKLQTMFGKVSEINTN